MQAAPYPSWMQSNPWGPCHPQQWGMDQPQTSQRTFHPGLKPDESTTPDAPPKDPSFLAWEKEKADAEACEAEERKAEQEDKTRRRARERLQNSIYEQVDFVNNIKAKVSPPPKPTATAAAEYRKREEEQKYREKRCKDEEALAKYRREAEERGRKEEWQEQFGTFSKGWEVQISGLRKTLEERERRDEIAAARSVARSEGVREGEERGRRERSQQGSRNPSPSRSHGRSRSRSRHRERGDRRGGVVKYGHGDGIDANLLLETALRAANTSRAINYPASQGLLADSNAYDNNQNLQLSANGYLERDILLTSNLKNTSGYLPSRFDELENGQRSMTSRFGGLENRFGGLEMKVDGLERTVSHRFDRLDDSMRNLSMLGGGGSRVCGVRGYGSTVGERGDLSPGWYRVD